MVRLFFLSFFLFCHIKSIIYTKANHAWVYTTRRRKQEKQATHTSRLIKKLDVVCTREVDENVTTKFKCGLSRKYYACQAQSCVFFFLFNVHYSIIGPRLIVIRRSRVPSMRKTPSCYMETLYVVSFVNNNQQIDDARNNAIENHKEM